MMHYTKKVSDNSGRDSCGMSFALNHAFPTTFCNFNINTTVG